MCLATLAGQVTYQSKSGYSRDFIYGVSPLCFWLRRGLVVQHLFLSCSTFGALWSLVSSRIGSPLVTAQNPFDHFVQFTAPAGGLRARRYFMQLI
ncbi:hypothetical protein L195_g060789 [Trifolium pratense]|uniref:Uncharacterized protein n=1 Tax=Trifolium pratense TaxID=57577 RepID=A0A2K3K600_TRIPR|nr:hypothetical protein L195_g060789 [Trifolium pratense]